MDVNLSKLCLLLIYLIENVICMRYDNHTLFRVIPTTDEQLEFFKNKTDYDAIFWRPPGLLRRPVDFSIGPEKKESFLLYAKENNIYYATVIEDIQSEFDQQIVKPYIRRRTDSFDWYNFYRLDDIYSWLHDLSQEHPSEFQVFSIGKTYENRDIMAVRINLDGGPVNRSTVIIEGGIHAREWISPACVTYMINEIFNAKTSADDELNSIALKYEWFFIPVLNPDGYEYSHTTDRLWRKNCHPNGGVDLNRNFDAKFGVFSVSFDKGTDVYCGESAFSELESQALRRFITEHSNNLLYYISFHSYGQYIVIPYAHTKEHKENYYEVDDLGEKIADRIYSLYETKYEVGTAYDTVGYLVSGASTCWVKGTFKTKYVITFELRDEGQHGFALPSEQILPTCKETMLGLRALFNPQRSTVVYTKDSARNKQIDILLNSIVIMFNTLLFIIARFE